MAHADSWPRRALRVQATAVLALLLSVVAPTSTHAICGDTIIDAGEDCDDGNTAGGDCCAATCLLESAGSPCPDDGNPCTDDACDGNGSCFPLNNTQPCSDSDPCTVGSVCGTGVCGVAAPDACIDHYMCYRARSTVDGTTHTVSIADQADSITAQVTTPKSLCPPASDNGSAILDSTLHQEGYRIRVADRSQREAGVRDQFGLPGAESMRSRTSATPSMFRPHCGHIDLTPRR